MYYIIPWILMGISFGLYQLYVAWKKSAMKKNEGPVRECYITEGLYLGMTVGFGLGYLAGVALWAVGIGMMIGVTVGFLIPKKKK